MLRNKIKRKRMEKPEHVFLIPRCTSCNDELKHFMGKFICDRCDIFYKIIFVREIIDRSITH
jgi:predicted RNA-binding Zn-ribbon protein involved in translation (DUF1610 family)